MRLPAGLNRWSSMRHDRDRRSPVHIGYQGFMVG